MKNENLGSIHPHEQQHCQSIFQGLKREQLQLHKVYTGLQQCTPLIFLNLIFFIWIIICTVRFSFFLQTNEELGSIFPLFSEFSSCGNALERVLALEMELAESLKTKKKSGFQRLVIQNLNATFSCPWLQFSNFDAAVSVSFVSLFYLLEAVVVFKWTSFSVFCPVLS